MCFSSSVPSQPVPPLAQTLQSYLKALEPLLPPEELNHTRRMVQEFGRAGGLGPRLQEGLEKRARHTRNWVCVSEGAESHCIYRQRGRGREMGVWRPSKLHLLCSSCTSLDSHLTSVKTEDYGSVKSFPLSLAGLFYYIY